ncbi:MAG: formylmethanofuran--tetrahydromethanopterin N-formyltransferase [bacterium]|nr:formylmethanofuran--tetrahydromethanopterin N-formyltransferase [bacterium]
MKIGSTLIEDTFAEAFSMRYTRLLVTAFDDHWLNAAIAEFAGFSASVIACDAEIAVEKRLSASETPDGRVGASLLAFGFSADALAKAMPGRVGQCLMTCPTTSVFDGLADTEKRIPLGKTLRYFGDGFQKSKVIAGKRFWRIPVMDGEFVVQEDAGVAKGVAGGNILIQSKDQATGLLAARRAVEALAECDGVIAPFPGGVVRSGSKVGSRYPKLKASTADAYCPTLRGRVETKLHESANCVYEIVIDGESEEAVGNAMRVMMRAAAGEGIVAIGAGNYGGKLGKFHFHLRELLS